MTKLSPISPTHACRNYRVWVIWVIWVIFGLTQAYFTELSGDEAYYWMYSRYIDWGYHDHPPMIAAMIRVGYELFPNELGVRLLTVFANAIAGWVLYKTTEEQNADLLTYMLLALVAFHFSALLAVPDSPLLLSCALYFFVLKKWLVQKTWGLTFVLGCIVTLMMYSKYHAGMVLFFTLCACPKLLKDTKFWAIVVISTILFAPHLYWMYLHDFSSLKFHLGFRSKEHYSLESLGAFFGGLVTITGPLIGFMLLPASYLFKPENDWQKVLKYCFVGILCFLFLLHFQTHIEANWFGTALIPMLLCAHAYIKTRPNWALWVKRLAIPSVLLIVAIRIYLAHDFLPSKWAVKSDYHGWKNWATELQNATDCMPLVFCNSYQLPAKYTFYTGDLAYAANLKDYHRTQYDFWDLEERVFRKDVKYVFNYKFHPFTEFRSSNHQFHSIANVTAFPNYGKILLEEINPKPIFKKNSTIDLDLLLTNHRDTATDLNFPPSCAPYIRYTFFDGNRIALSEKTAEPIRRIIKDTLHVTANIKTPSEKGNYYFICSFDQCMEFSMNGRLRKVKVE